MIAGGQKTQHIYFAAALDKIKIGCSVKPIDRIAQVGEWIPFPITLLATMPGSYALEATLHRMFAEEWSHGEWFNASARLSAFVERVAKGLPVGIDDRQLTEIENNRRHAIADKKRIGRHVAKLPRELVIEFRAVPKGVAMPDDLLARCWAAVGEAA